MSSRVMTTVSITPHQYSSNHCYPDSVFIGGFSVDSPEYTRSCTYSRVRANQPGISRWYYETKVITYITQCSASVPYALFALNHPIAVTTGLVDANHNPFALYGMVRGITLWSETVPMEINYSVTVECPIRPGFKLTWPKTPPGRSSQLVRSSYAHTHSRIQTISLFLSPLVSSIRWPLYTTMHGI